jgi:hypothetical protein
MSLDAKARDWLAANVSADDVKLLTPLFTAQGVLTLADFEHLSREDLMELKVPIGPRNRFMDAVAKLKQPVAPPAPVAPQPKTPPKATKVADRCFLPSRV